MCPSWKTCRESRASCRPSAPNGKIPFMATITEIPTALTFEEKLDRLAQVAINAGLGLQRGQQLVMTASMDALPLARLITAQAYKAGASLVTTLYTDEQSTLLRYRYGQDGGFANAA